MCLPGTRQQVLTIITTWLNSTDESSKVLWLADIGGSGKSTVAQHIASVATRANQLLCSFYFKRDIKAQSSTIPVVANLSHQLAERSGPIAAEIFRASQAGSTSCLDAFHSHITVPLCLHPPIKPSLIIIDALDESGPPSERADFLSALVQEAPLLPSTVKIMLTSKPSLDISEALDRLSASSFDNEAFGCYRLTFDVYGQATRSDISKYITHSFRVIAQNLRSKGLALPEPWPSDIQRKRLTGRANGLFLWISIAATYVDNSENPQRALEELLALQHKASPDAAMDALYHHILQATESSPGFNLRVYRATLEVILSAENPLRIQEINQQIEQDATSTLAYLRPVLHCEPEVRVAHSSFADYVQDPQKCDPKFLISRNSGVMPRAWDIVSDVGSQIKEGTVSRYPISRGGFGEIWSARHIDGRKIAIKTLWLHGDLAAFDPHSKLEKRATKELSVWRKLDHPNVLKLLGICALGSSREIGMVSEWMPNENVTQYILKHREADRIQLITGVATGLAYLHGNGIIHGDLKGANVVIAANGTARLMDFGLAKVVESTLKFSTSTLQGTTRWMAPELMDPEEKSKAVITFPTDIYSLGMTILVGFIDSIHSPRSTVYP
ncbi:unnamed protein product [Rhizoctonia solani]|uniref:Protein kinase domain-containing protein n=1 Tax=Rhizoctonia solani TaxID=456999 RepID=A0A8H2XZ85_9AGAM|nr:unnamed protein product [Rhizoctonia solani]